jgi:hypothetical protein
MWLWDIDLHALGFRRKSERYWRCERRHGLRADAHLSVFSWSEQAIPGRRRGPSRYLVELTEFHVTFHVRLDRVHFYYHELGNNEWQPYGHTSGRELRRLGCDRRALRAEADGVAGLLVAALGGVLLPRRRRARQDG